MGNLEESRRWLDQATADLKTARDCPPIAKIDRYKDLVVKALGPQAVVLFGSFAKGEINEGSDVDIMVIAKFKGSFLDRIKLLLDFEIIPEDRGDFDRYTDVV